MLRRRSLLPPALAVLAALLVPVAAPAAAPAVPAPVALNAGWHLQPDPQDRGQQRDLQRPGPLTAGWRPTSVPGVFDTRARKADFHGTIGWYRLDFTAPAAGGGFAWGLHFEQVRRTAKVWLNGAQIGSHTDPYVPFTLVARGLRPGARNTLVVRVDNRKGKEPREGWWNWGGIARPVTLVPLGAVVAHEPGLLSDVDCPQGGGACAAKVLVDTVLENRGPTTVDAPRLALRLQPPGGGPPIDAEHTARALAPGERTRVRFEVPVPDPKLWAPGSPARYAATLTTLAGDVPQQVDHRLVGLRSVRVVNGTLALNGRQLALRGAAVQEDTRGHGPVMGPAEVRRIVAELKALHANVTRAHYLLNDRLLDALDAAGIMVWSQAPIYHRDRLLENASERATALATLRGTVLAARNHPSVITHSVANELSAVPDRVPGTSAYLEAARGVVADLDPTLPPSIDLLSYPGYGRQRAYAQFPLLGINSYFGWYPGKTRHSTARLADLGPYLDRMRKMYASSALVVTEFGAESTFNGPPTEKESYAFQSRYVRSVLDQVERRPFVGGAIYWTLREFAVKPDWDGGAARAVKRSSIHHKGLIDYAGRRKPAFAVAERDYARTPLYRQVSAAAGLGRATGAGGGSPLLLFGVAFAVLALLLLDGWAIAGILRGRRRRRADGDAKGADGAQPAPARAA